MPTASPFARSSSSSERVCVDRPYSTRWPCRSSANGRVASRPSTASAATISTTRTHQGPGTDPASRVPSREKPSQQAIASDTASELQLHRRASRENASAVAIWSAENTVPGAGPSPSCPGPGPTAPARPPGRRRPRRRRRRPPGRCAGRRGSRSQVCQQVLPELGELGLRQTELLLQCGADRWRRRGPACRDERERPGPRDRPAAGRRATPTHTSPRGGWWWCRTRPIPAGSPADRPRAPGR